MSADFTVAICHLNQGHRIETPLRAILAQLDRFEAPLLLVDNGSDDGSIGIFERLAQEHSRFRFICETRRGVYYARRAAILATATPFLIFLDDDAEPEPDFFARLMRRFANDGTIGVIGGRIDPIWNGDPPAWMPAKLANEFAADPRLPRSGVTEARFPFLPTGAALGLRLCDCARLFTDEPRATDYPLGRRAGDRQRGVEPSALGGEDTDLCRIYAANGWRVLFDNEARVALHIPPERLRPEWFIARYYAEGRTRIRLLRTGGSFPIGRHSLRHLLGLLPLALLVTIGPILGPRPRLLARAYFAKSCGAWFELLFGWRGAAFPFTRTAIRDARPGS